MKVFCKDCVHYGICEYSPFSDKKIECKDFICKVDYVEVVKCKDCRYYNKEFKNFFGNCKCEYIGIGVYPDSYCSHGERKSE